MSDSRFSIFNRSSSDADGDTTTSDDSITLDSPVAALNSLSSNSDDSTYGSREDELQEVRDRDGSTSDEVDARKLFDDPTVNMIRWQYRENGIASTIVDKPVRDAFKYGFDLKFSDDTDDTDEIREFIRDEYVPKQKQARIKSRRDGVSLLYWVTDDTSDASQPIENPNGVGQLRVVTIDELAHGDGNPRYENRYRTVSDEVSAQRAADATDYNIDQLVVTRSGLVVVDDITSVDHEKFVGCMMRQNPQLAEQDHFQFIHADRLELFVTRETVDGDMEEVSYGHVEGDSMLTPVIHSLVGITKAEWALGQTLLRYTAPLHVVEIDKEVSPKENDWESHINEVDDQLDNLNTKSSLTLPPGHVAKTLTADSDIDPEPYLDGLINNVCAGAEITRSVLQGTQAGTVSGQSTDAKNYFNLVEKNRENEYSEKLRNGVNRYMTYTGRSGSLEDIEWGPLFKVDAVERVDGMMTLVSAISNAVGSYLIPLDDAQEILEEQWAEFDADIDPGELTEEELDLLDRVNTTKGKQYQEGNSAEQEYESKHLGNNGGGRESGQSDDESDPSSGDE